VEVAVEIEKSVPARDLPAEEQQRRDEEQRRLDEGAAPRRGSAG
jgi:hypothetical protein